ncbi:MAG TPA: DUF72 domain-containing protein [Chloroflexota bacterium]|jgi:uncharacterized protein YecE (DUF72 family)|nr:DUF72 domain-containing protein [Chloroflexota bacterium]
MAHAYLGTSGFSYPEWRPSFYPPDLKPEGFLAFYAQHLPAVEIDGTFYRMPNARTLEAWRSAVPDGFKFTLKASQKITHFERLKLPSEAHDYLVGVLPKLGDRLGVHFYQLPPNFRRSDERLETFLANRPKGIPAAFEFRHESWFDGAVYRLLERAGVGLVVNEGDEGATPLEVTAPLVYLRLRKERYTEAERDGWLRRIDGWVREGIDVFAFIKHEENPDAPRLAAGWARALGAGSQ